MVTRENETFEASLARRIAVIMRPGTGVVNAGAVLLALACALVAADAVKPLHIDDPFMYRVAEQVARHPLDPYGFDVFWYQWPQPMVEELAPPVVPYWLALGLRLFGDRPVLWKLWLFPFAVTFVVSLHALLRRFAPLAARPATALVVLSPAVLPGLNLMQDIPALALGLTGLVGYLRAADTGRMRWALAAGAIAGLAAQTKYTALTFVAAIGIHAVLHSKLRPGLTVAAVAAAVFSGWDGLMTLRYGRGMFLGQLGTDLFWTPRGEMAWSLVTVVGGVAPILALMILAPRLPRVAAVAGTVVVVGFAMLARRPIEHRLYLTLGAMSAALIATAAMRVLFTLENEDRGDRRASAFLVLWLVLETVAYFFAAPFAAVRRVLGVIVAAVLVVAHGASRDLARVRTSGASARGRFAPLLVMNAALAVLFSTVDVREAQAQREVIDAAVRAAHRRDAGSTIWYLGHWGFNYYAPRAGMRRLIPDHTFVREGDWIVIPARVDKPAITLDPSQAELVDVVAVDDRLPFKTSFGYYGGRWPLEHLRGPRLELTLFRLTRDCIPRSEWSVGRIATFVRHAGGMTASWTVPALVRGLDDPDASARGLAAEALAELGTRAVGAGTRLAALLQADPETSVRAKAAFALGRIGERGDAIRTALARAAADPQVAVRISAVEAVERLGDTVRE